MTLITYLKVYVFAQESQSQITKFGPDRKCLAFFSIKSVKNTVTFRYQIMTLRIKKFTKLDILTSHITAVFPMSINLYTIKNNTTFLILSLIDVALFVVEI